MNSKDAKVHADECVVYLAKRELTCLARRQYVEDTFLLFGEQIVPPLLDRLSLELDKSAPTDAVRLPLLYFIGIVGPSVKEIYPAVGQLLGTSLDSDKKTTRLAGAYANWEIGGSPSCLTQLSQLIRKDLERCSPLRLLALRGLGATGSDAAPVVNEIVECLSPSDSLSIRCEAARTLARIGPAASPALSRLLDLVNCGPADFTLEVLNALSRIGGSRTLVRNAIQRVANICPDVLPKQFAAVLAGIETGKYESACRAFESFVSELGSIGREEGVIFWLNAMLSAIGQRARARFDELVHLDLKQVDAVLRSLDLREPCRHLQKGADDVWETSKEDAATVIDALEALQTMGQSLQRRVEGLKRAFELNDNLRVRKSILEELGKAAARSRAKADHDVALEVFNSVLTIPALGSGCTSEEGLLREGAVNGVASLLTTDSRATQLLLSVLQAEQHPFARRVAAARWLDFVVRDSAKKDEGQKQRLVDETLKCLDWELRRSGDWSRVNTHIVRPFCAIFEQYATLAQAAIPTLERLVETSPKESRPQIQKTLTHIENCLNVSQQIAMDVHGRHQSGAEMSVVSTDEQGRSKNGRSDSKSLMERMSALEQLEKTNRRENREIQRRLARIEEKMEALLDASSESAHDHDPQTTPLDLIQSIRRNKRMSLEEIGAELGLSKSQMSRIARGQCELKKSARIVLEQLAGQTE